MKVNRCLKGKMTCKWCGAIFMVTIVIEMTGISLSAAPLLEGEHVNCPNRPITVPVPGNA